eukprot:1132052-Pyramimonas_sp.AAC.1
MASTQVCGSACLVSSGSGQPLGASKAQLQASLGGLLDRGGVDGGMESLWRRRRFGGYQDRVGGAHKEEDEGLFR